MQVVRVPTANGIDDIKLIGQTELERMFIKQLAEAGTLSCMSRHVADSVLFRPISVASEYSGSGSSAQKPIGKYDFTVLQNQNQIFGLTLNDGLLAPINLTQYPTIKLQVKPRKSTSPIIELSLGSGLVVSGVNNNVLTVSFTAEQTKLMTLENYYYDILMSKPTSNVYYIEGKITVKFTGTR